MSITTINTGGGYADFKLVVSTLGVPKGVFWFDNGTTFLVWAIMDNQGNVITASAGGASPPAGFSTDFPNAVALSGNLSIS